MRLRSAIVEFEDRLKPLPREVQLVKGAKGDKPGEIVYDLGARLPVEAVRLIRVPAGGAPLPRARARRPMFRRRGEG